MKRRVRQARSAVLRTCGVLMRYNPGADRDWRRLARAWLLEAATHPGSDRAQILALHLLEASRTGLKFTADGETVDFDRYDGGDFQVEGPVDALARYSASSLAVAATIDTEDVTPELREEMRRALADLEERLQRVKDAGEAEEAT